MQFFESLEVGGMQRRREHHPLRQRVLRCSTGGGHRLIAAQCELASTAIALSRGSSPPSAEETEFLDRYSVHPEAGERVEAPLASLRWMDRIAAGIRRSPGIRSAHRLRLHPRGAACRTASRHPHDLSPASGERFALRGSRRAGHHRPCELHGIAGAGRRSRT